MSVVDLGALARALDAADPTPLTGKVVRATGLLVEAALPRVPVGTACEIRARDGGLVLAEVVGFQAGTAQLMPLSDIQGIGEGCEVVPRESADRILVGEGLLGRVVDANLRPVDGGRLIRAVTEERVALLDVAAVLERIGAAGER